MNHREPYMIMGGLTNWEVAADVNHMIKKEGYEPIGSPIIRKGEWYQAVYKAEDATKRLMPEVGSEAYVNLLIELSGLAKKLYEEHHKDDIYFELAVTGSGLINQIDRMTEGLIRKP